ncbi:uncharacterized protein LOC121726189 isoform X2 [Aricia agestis]|uniref:uncharacterized protein LOC121726189 isoform X2 n=1 Tax=Aricia agestis TaxID=91739 RepID=UPI001C209C04|nr:uncharacterized protein LOC121726189 isoform X2 [Aricia agestis]
MALYSSNVDASQYIDAEYSSGDSNNIKSKQYQEENNNNIDELSQHLSEMGCIVDAVKRPPNTCMETCVYEEPDERLSRNNISSETNDATNEDNYSDEFDEESSDKEEGIQPQPSKITEHKIDKPPLKLSKSCSGNFSKPPSISARSSDFGSTSTITRSRRVNMSFSNDRLRDIERHNHILLNKILSARNRSPSA